MQKQSRPSKRRHEGIEVRHQVGCRAADGGRCSCKPGPSYRGYVYDRRTGKKRKSPAFPTLAAAKGWRADAQVALKQGRLSAPSKRTVAEAANEWMAKAEAGSVRARGRRPYKPSTLRGYRADLDEYLLPALGAFKLSEVRRSDVQALADRLLEGRENGRGRWPNEWPAEPLSPSRVRNVLMPLRVVYRHELRRDDGLVANPTEGLDLPSVEGGRERVATPEEAERLFAVLPDDARAIYGAAFYGGLRCGELQALRWDDVDLAKGVLRVERSWDSREGQVAPKSEKGTRGVPVNGTLRDYLDAQKARTGRGGDDFVLGSKPTHPFTPSNIRRKAHKAWAEANADRAEKGLDALKPIGLHECRHSYVSWMHEAGHTLEEIGDYVGHSSAYMTDRYRHLLEGHERRSVARQDDYLGNGGAKPGIVQELRDLLDRADPGELAASAAEVRALVDGHLARAER